MTLKNGRGEARGGGGGGEIETLLAKLKQSRTAPNFPRI